MHCSIGYKRLQCKAGVDQSGLDGFTHVDSVWIVSVNTNGVRFQRDLAAVDGRHFAAVKELQQSRAGGFGVFDHGAGLRPGYQVAVVGVASVGKYFRVGVEATLNGCGFEFSARDGQYGTVRMSAFNLTGQ